jgi:hypothetical protein
MLVFNANKMQVLGESVQFMLTNTSVDKDKFPDEVKMPAPRKAAGKTHRK